MLIIGERINTSIPYIREAYEGRQAQVITDEARAQWAAGADYLDVNAGLKASTNEPWLCWALDIIQEAVPAAKLVVDTTRANVMRAAFARLKETRDVFVNSVTNQENRLEGMLPLVKEYGCKLIALTIDGEGMPDTAQGRYDIAARLAETLTLWEIPLGDVYIDFLALPIAFGDFQSRVSLDTLSLIRAQIPEIKTLVNVSAATWKLPNRSFGTGILQAMLMARGIDAVILNPLDRQVMDAVVAAKALLGEDPACDAYLRRFGEGDPAHQRAEAAASLKTA